MISLVRPQDKIYGCQSLTIINKVTLSVGMFVFPDKSIISVLLDIC